MPEPRDHAEKRNWVEIILRRIPGFRGYLEKEYRRESDELQRQWLADRLQRSKRAIDEAARPLVETGQIDLMPQVDRLRGRLDKFIWQLRSAVQGYSGFLDLVRVDQAMLDRVYEVDVSLMDEVQTLAEAIESLPSRGESLASALPELLNQIDNLETQWGARNDILKGLE
ncbi:MAG TPA: hypothetical protein DD670_13100 [Planctomycetaceae bacterium]|nr:hypothetical protein [Planctomycetaceae bacterium]